MPSKPNAPAVAAASMGGAGAGASRPVSATARRSAAVASVGGSRSLAERKKEMHKTLFTVTAKAGQSACDSGGGGGGSSSARRPAASDDFTVHSVADATKVQDTDDADAGADAGAAAAGAGAGIDDILSGAELSLAVAKSPARVGGGGGGGGGGGALGAMDADTRLRVLQRANDELKKQLTAAKREGKENVRVQMIKRLRVQLLEQTELTNALRKKYGMSDADFEAVYQKVLNTPERVRPPRPEQLLQQIALAKAESFKLRDQLTAAKQHIRTLEATAAGAAPPSARAGAHSGAAGRGGGGGDGDGDDDGDGDAGAIAADESARARDRRIRKADEAFVAANAAKAQQLSRHVLATTEREVGEMRHALGVARAEVAAKQQLLAAHAEALESARAEQAKLQVYADKYKRADARCTEMQKLCERMKLELVRSVADHERLQAQVRALQSQVSAGAGAAATAAAGSAAASNPADVIALVQLRADLSAAQEQGTAQRTEIAALKQKLAAALAAAAAVAPAAESAPTPRTAAKLDAAAKDAEQLRSRVSELEADLNKSRDALAAATSAAPAAAASAPSPRTVQELSDARAKVAQLETDLNTAQAAVTAANDRAAAAEAAATAAAAAAAAANARAPAAAANSAETDALRIRVADLEAELARAAADRAADTRSHELHLAQVTATQQALTAAQLNAKDAQCSAMQAQIDALNAKLRAAGDDSSRPPTPKLGDLDVEAEAALHQRVADLQNELERAQAARAADSKTHEQHIAQVTAAQQQLSAAQAKAKDAQVRALQAQASSQQLMIDALKAKLTAAGSGAAAAPAAAPAAAAAPDPKVVAAAVSAATDPLQKRIAVLEGQLQEAKAAANAAATKAAAATAAAAPAPAAGDSELRDKVMRLEEQLSEMQAQADFQDERISKIPDEVEDARKEGAAEAKQAGDRVITQLKVQIKGLESDLADAQKGAAAAPAAATPGASGAALQKRVSELEAQLADANKAAAAAAAAAASASGGGGAAEKELRDKITRLEEQIEEMKIQAEYQDERISKIPDEIDDARKEAEAEAKQAGDRVITQLKVQIKGLEKDLAAASTGKPAGSNPPTPSSASGAAELNAARKQVAELQAALAEAKKAAAAAAGSGGSGGDKDLRDRLVRLEEELAEQKAQAEYQDERISKIPDELDEARREAEADAKKLSDAVATQLKVQIKGLELDLAEALKARGAPGAGAADHSACEATIQSLRSDLESKTSEAEYQDARIAQFPAQLDDARAEALADAKKLSDPAIAALKLKVSQLEAELAAAPKGGSGGGGKSSSAPAPQPEPLSARRGSGSGSKPPVAPGGSTPRSGGASPRIGAAASPTTPSASAVADSKYGAGPSPSAGAGSGRGLAPLRSSHSSLAGLPPMGRRAAASATAPSPPASAAPSPTVRAAAAAPAPAKAKAPSPSASIAEEIDEAVGEGSQDFVVHDGADA